MNLKGKDFLKILDFEKEELLYLIDLAIDFKNKKKNNEDHSYLKGKNIALIFEKDSTRTRCSFEVAAHDLGIATTYLGSDSHIGKKESIMDTARVLDKIYDGIEYRGFSQGIVEEFAKYSNVPVWNGLTDEFHPTQALADILTIYEHFGKLEGLNFVYIGNGNNNVSNSLMIICAKLGINYTCISPKELWPNEELVIIANNLSKNNNSSICITDKIDIDSSVNVIYTDVWVSMGEEDLWKERIDLLKPYTVNSKIIGMADSNAIFMHCLPSFHNTDTNVSKDIENKYGLTEMEVTNEVFESNKSVVFQQSENRMHTIKAIIYATLK